MAAVTLEGFVREAVSGDGGGSRPANSLRYVWPPHYSYCRHSTSRRPPSLRLWPRRVGSARLAQEAEERRCYRRLIKTPDRISERPPRGGLSICAVCCGASGANGTSRHSRRCQSLSPIGPRADKFGLWRGAVCELLDPTATLAVHCGNGFDAGLAPIEVFV